METLDRAFSGPTTETLPSSSTSLPSMTTSTSEPLAAASSSGSSSARPPRRGAAVRAIERFINYDELLQFVEADDAPRPRSRVEPAFVPAPLSEYKLQRQRNVAHNQSVLHALGLGAEPVVAQAARDFPHLPTPDVVEQSVRTAVRSPPVLEGAPGKRPRAPT